MDFSKLISAIAHTLIVILEQFRRRPPAQVIPPPSPHPFSMFTRLFPPSLSRLTRVVLVAALALSLFVPLVSGLLMALAGWLSLLAQVATCLFVVSAGLLGSTLLLTLAAWCATRPAAAPGRPDVGP